jgi:penicillin-binding protein 1A
MTKSRPPKSSAKGRGRPSAIVSTRPSRPGARKSVPPKQRAVRVLLTILAALLFAGTLVALVGLGTLWYYSRDLPSADALRKYTPPQTTRIVDRKGALLAELYTERRTVVSMEKVPRVLVLSVLAAEDADFYHHAGMDLPSLLRVVGKLILKGRATQGGSTITQQVVKNLLLSPERTLERKIKELILARRIEQELKKDEILWLYLNHINFGHGRYGVEEASQYYFGKHVEQLNLTEASLIAGIPQSPTYLSPRTHPDAARKRQLFVLGQLEQKRDLYWDDLPLAEIEAARQKPAQLAPAPVVNMDAPELTSLVKQTLVDAVGAERAARGGFTVVTTIDDALQVSARKALRHGLEEHDSRHAHVAPFTAPKLSDAAFAKLRDETRVDHPARTKLEVGKTYDAVMMGAPDASHVELSINGVSALCNLSDLARYNPKGLAAKDVARPGVKLRATVLSMPGGKPVLARLVPGAEGATIVIEPRTREVLALVGGYEAGSGFNRALQAVRQPASTFKPVVYALGIQSRKFTPATMVIDAPSAYDGKYEPANYDTFEGPVLLRYALARSKNSVAVRVIEELRPPAVAEMARAFGITTQLEPKQPEQRDGNLSLALGAWEVKLSELANVYATLAAGGRYQPLRFVKRIVDSAGHEVKLTPVEGPRDVLTPAEAYVVTNLLTSVIEEGTGAKAKALGRPAAGKTGTSNEACDTWFMGYTSELTAGVWIGYDDRRSLGAKESGSKAALPVWLDIMKAAHQGKPVRGFDVPSGVVSAKIDPATGKLAYEGQQNALDEVFVEGTVPTEVALPPDVADPTTFLMEQLGSAGSP